MNFYLDFEATQFSDRIISIGCVSEAGEKFNTLVKPPKGDKVSNFITALTGITNEELAGAPSADEAFNSFFDFVIENNDDRPPKFFCYGDCDATFIKSTVIRMKDVRAITFARSILPALFDYSASVKKYFNTDQGIALRKLFSFMQEDEVVQTHNALDDAIMLREVASELLNFCQPDDLIKIKAIPGQAKPKIKKEKKAPDVFINFKGDMWHANTLADATNYKIKCAGRNNHFKYFDSVETAVMWIIKYKAGGSPKDENNVKSRINYINKAILTGNRYCSLHWYEKGNE